MSPIDLRPLFLVSVSVAAAIAACSNAATPPANDTAQPEALTSRFDALLDQVVAGGVPGVGLYVHRRGREPYFATRGVADLTTGEALTPNHVFRIASMSKPYLSTLVVKMAVEGKLSLDDHPDRYLPADISALIPGANNITLYDMLTMWSGIADYRDLQFVIDVVAGDHAKVRDEYTDLVDGLRRNPTPCASPEIPLDQVTDSIGACLYSNSNYVLTGFIVDKLLYGVDPGPGVRPEHHSRAFREQLFAPLGLRSTFYEKHLASGQSFQPRLAHGYATPPAELANPVLTDVTSWDDGNGYANGGLIATLDDVAKFRRAIFDEREAFPMATLDAKKQFLALFTKTNPLGLAPGGLLLEDHTWIFAGDIGGYTCWSGYLPERDASVVLFANDRDFEEPRQNLVDAVMGLVKSASE